MIEIVVEIIKKNPLFSLCMVSETCLFFFFNGFDYFPKQIRCIWIIDLSDMLELNPNTVLVDGWYSYLF